MTAKKIVQKIPQILQSVPLVNAAQTEDPTGWSDVLGQLDGADDVEVHVYAEPEKGNGGSAWAFSCSPDDYTWSDLLTRIKGDPDLGPGRYSLRAKRGTQFIGRKVVQIAGRPRSSGGLLPAAAPAGPPQPDILSAMREMQAQADKRFSDLLMVLLTKMPSGNGGGASIADVISAAKMLTEGRAAPTDPIIGIRQLLEVQALLKSAADGGPEPAGAGTMDAIVKALDVLGPVLAQNAKRPPDPPTLPSVAVPVPLPRPSSPPTGAAADAAPKPKPDRMRVLLHRMIRAAERDGDPGVYAQVAIDELGDEMISRLLAMPDPQSVLASADPRIEKHREWFAALLTELREAYADPEPGQAGGLTTPEHGSDLAGDDPATT